MVVTPWLQDELVIVASANSELVRLARTTATGARISLKTLREAVWLLREPGSGTRESTDQALLPHLRSYRRSIELGSSEAIKRAVEEDLGLGCLSRWVVDDSIDAGRLNRLPTTLPRLARQCYVVVHRDRQPTPTLRRFIAQVCAGEALDR